MLTAIAAIIIFSFLIIIHEFGHYITAKIFGVKVHEFSIGMGPAIFKREKHDTVYALRWLPIGGYVKLEGEDTTSDDINALYKQSKWKRVVILSAGSIMNLILGLIVSIILVAPVAELDIPVISRFSENSPSQAAGLQIGDRVVKINNSKINTLMDSRFETFRAKTDPVSVTVERNGELITKMVTPIETENGEYLLGYAPVFVKNTPLRTIEYGFYQSVFVVKSIVATLGDLIKGQGYANLSGPVGIVGEIGSAVEHTSTDLMDGVLHLMWLFMLISINLGVFNLLPIPALDGGRIFFVLVEAVIRKPIPPEKEGFVHLIGFAFLICLMIFATYNDLIRLI